jgi:hypothetical protein
MSGVERFSRYPAANTIAIAKTAESSQEVTTCRFPEP